MRNATSILVLGASALTMTLIAACGGGDDGGVRGGAGTSSTAAGTNSNPTAGTTGNNTSGSSSTAGTTGTAGTGTGGASSCTMAAGPKSGDGTNTTIDEIDDTNTMFTPAGTGAGSWDFSKDASPTGMIVPTGTTTLVPVAMGHTGSALHVTGTGLAGWGASLAAFLNGPTGSFDASKYGGVAFWIKGTTDVQEGKDHLMVQARMPDVLPGPGSCCNDTIVGSECYSGHRVVIGITADWTEVKIGWTDFKNATFGLGSTLAFNANRIRDINFSFNHDSAATTTSSSFDFWVDGLRFLKSDEMGNVVPVTTGGSSAGGSASGGTGGSGGATTGGGGASAGGTGGVGGTN